jgi:hypothetical protein
MITTILIIHSLLAVTMLGALTHQTLALWWPARTGHSVATSFRGVRSQIYTNTIVVLFVLTAIGGALLYPSYRIGVRPILEQLRLNSANGIFELKEHAVAIGLGMLPAYWYYWRQPLAPEYRMARRMLTSLLAVIVWWGFLTGHILNNIRGFGL